MSRELIMEGIYSSLIAYNFQAKLTILAKRWRIEWDIAKGPVIPKAKIINNQIKAGEPL